MYYNKNVIVVTLMLSALLLSCDKDVSNETGGSGVPMNIVSSVAADDTKASIRTSDLKEFYLQINSGKSAYNYFEVISRVGSEWGAGKRLYWPDETTPVTYCAALYGDHVFTRDEFAGGVDLTVPTDQSTQEKLNSADLLTLMETQLKYENSVDGALPVVLNHGLAKVVFILSFGDDFYDNNFGIRGNPVNSITVNGTNTGFNFQPQTGQVTVTPGTQADITPQEYTYAPGTANAKTAIAVYEVILAPQTLAVGKLALAFSVGACNYKWTNTTAINLSAGNTYNIPVSVSTSPGPYNGRAYVDMGNGLKWATCNVGAINPWNFGDYFAWGETEPYYLSLEPLIWKEGKTNYGWASYSDNPSGDGETFEKYALEKKTVLEPDDDAAQINWGGRWRTPTDAEWTWMRENCIWVWTDDYNGTGVKGEIVTSNIDGYKENSIFLPATGFFSGSSRSNIGILISYWSSTLFDSDSNGALIINYGKGNYAVVRMGTFRRHGLPVRPVAE